jgi:hypothetical protein
MFAKLKERIRTVIYTEARKALEDVMFEESFNIERQIQRAAMEESARYVLDHIDLHKVCPDRLALLDRCLNILPSDGLVLEFGVYKGSTIRHIAGRLPKRQVYGFDSFEGLDEPWMYHSPGLFKVEQIPAVPENVTLVKGFFQDTCSHFLAGHPGDIAFAHIDSDLYSSCKYILQAFEGRIVPGTVILFDEYYNYPRWRGGEFKAFHEWCTAAGAIFEFVGFTARRGPIHPGQFASGHQVAIRILTRETPGANLERTGAAGRNDTCGREVITSLARPFRGIAGDEDTST